MVRVKICGITNEADALHAAACGADALGFIFYSGSPRFINRDQARRIISALPPFIARVGLFVDETPAQIRETVEYCGLDTIQLHGDETPEQCNLPPHRILKALPLKDESVILKLEEYRVSAIVLDAWVEGRYGGTGVTCNWDLAAKAAEQHCIILAGGLTPHNVAEAVSRVRPYGVDVSSGVEIEPGRKDPDLVAEFIRLAKEEA